MLTLKRAIRIYLVLIVLFLLYRIAFTVYFGGVDFIGQNSSELLKAFFMGFRYDSIVACYGLIPFFLLSVLRLFTPFKIFKKLVERINILYVVLFTLFVAILLISDLGFYSYFQDHLNILAFGFFEDDTMALLETMRKNYPLIPGVIGLGIFSILLFFIFIKIFKSRKVKKRMFITKVFISLIALTFFVGGIRGGYSVLVLSPKYSDFSTNQLINDISLNGVITFEKAYKLRNTRSSLEFNMAQAMGYGDDIHKAFSDYLEIDASSTNRDQLLKLVERKTPVNLKAAKLRPHVVVLLMESFGSHWMKYNDENFNFLGELATHFKDDIYFDKIISGDNGTIGSLMVLSTNIPHRNGARFISESRYMRLPLKTSAHLPFEQEGYESNFLYGGKLSWRDIGRFYESQGYTHIEGESHIKESLKLSGRQGTEWGLYDEHFFNHIYKKLENSKKPQFLIGLSTTNHPPFEVPSSFDAPVLAIPENLKNRISREEDLFIERFKAFQYSNYKLAEFIKKIKSSKLGENTIIVVTGDHNFWGFMNYTSDESYSKFRVPLYFYIPKSIAPKQFNKDIVGGHEDIMTTLYNISLSAKPFYSFGDDLFNSDNSNALGGSIYAGKFGGFYKGKKFVFDELKTDFAPNATVPLDELKIQYRSTLTVSDFFLRSEYENSLKKSPINNH